MGNIINRNETRKIFVNGVQIGGQNKVVIQSMTNTKTKDIESTVKQILELENAGCEIIRVACLDLEAFAENRAINSLSSCALCSIFLFCSLFCFAMS